MASKGFSRYFQKISKIGKHQDILDYLCLFKREIALEKEKLSCLLLTFTVKSLKNFKYEYREIAWKNAF